MLTLLAGELIMVCLTKNKAKLTPLVVFFKALMVKGIALHQMLLQGLRRPFSKQHTARRFDAVAYRDDDIQTIQLDRLIRKSNVQILHIAILLKLCLFKHFVTGTRRLNNSCAWTSLS